MKRQQRIPADVSNNYNKTMNVFPLLDNKKTIPYLILSWIWYIGILFGVLAVFSKHRLLQVFLVIFLVTFIVWIIGNFVIKKYKIIGTLEIGKESITIKNSGDFDYKLNKVEKLKMKYGGSKGDSYGVYAGLFRVNDGSNNSISFDYEGRSYKFSFLVTNKFFLNSLSNLFKTWEQNGINFIVTTTNKGVITKKVLDRKY